MRLQGSTSSVQRKKDILNSRNDANDMLANIFPIHLALAETVIA